MLSDYNNSDDAWVDGNTPKKNEERKFVSKKWGFEDWIVNTSEFCGKVLFIARGQKTSWHYHEVKDECFYVLKGRLKILLSKGVSKLTDETFFIILQPGESFKLPKGHTHELIAYDGDVTFIEFSTHHEDSDSYRLKDDGTPL
jgi:mannose-6-phosphate isomerase-like protein (cupin superfamily)